MVVMIQVMSHNIHLIAFFFYILFEIGEYSIQNWDILLPILLSILLWQIYFKIKISNFELFRKTANFLLFQNFNITKNEIYLFKCGPNKFWFCLYFIKSITNYTFCYILVKSITIFLCYYTFCLLYFSKEYYHFLFWLIRLSFWNLKCEL